MMLRFSKQGGACAFALHLLLFVAHAADPEDTCAAGGCPRPRGDVAMSAEAAMENDEVSLLQVRTLPKIRASDGTAALLEIEETSKYTKEEPFSTKGCNAKCRRARAAKKKKDRARKLAAAKRKRQKEAKAALEAKAKEEEANEPVLLPVDLTGTAGEISRLAVELEKDGSLKSASVKKFAEEALQEKQLIGAKDTCAMLGEKGTACEAPSAANTPTDTSKRCCFEFRLDGMKLSNVPEQWKKPDGDLSLAVTIPSQAGFDAGVTKFIQDLPLPPEKREKMAGKLWAQGITTEKQLSKMDAGSLSEELELPEGGAIANMLGEKQKQARAENEAGTSKEEDDAEKQLAESRDQAAKAQEATEKIRKEIEEETKKAADDAHEATQKQAKENLNHLQSKLADAKLKGANVNADAAAAEAKVNSLYANKGKNASAFVGGKAYSTLRMIRANGLFRGVRITENIQDTMLRPVLELNSDWEGKKDDELELAVALTPDLEASELTVEATSSASFESVNKMIQTAGVTSATASSASFGFGISIFGVGIGSSGKTSKASSSSKQSENEFEKQLAKKTTSFYKTAYYLEPRTLIAVEPRMMKVTQGFKKALDDVAKGHMAVHRMFHLYGTHTCPRALLGGWMRITGSYKSNKAQTTMKMAAATSLAMEESKSRSIGASAEGANKAGTVAVQMNGGVGEASKKSKEEGEAMKSEQEAAKQGDMLNTQTEWKGGSSNNDLASWRKSLGLKLNSNWKVIDRYENECIPHWRWVKDDPPLAYTLCSTWTEMRSSQLDPFVLARPDTICKDDEDEDMGSQPDVRACAEKVKKAGKKKFRYGKESQEGRCWAEAGNGKCTSKEDNSWSTYKTVDNLAVTDTICGPKPKGYKSPTQGKHVKGSAVFCKAGYHRDSASSSCRPCDSSHFQPNNNFPGDSCTKCEANCNTGSYLKGCGKHSAGSCVPCSTPPGAFKKFTTTGGFHDSCEFECFPPATVSDKKCVVEGCSNDNCRIAVLKGGSKHFLGVFPHDRVYPKTVGIEGDGSKMHDSKAMVTTKFKLLFRGAGESGRGEWHIIDTSNDRVMYTTGSLRTLRIEPDNSKLKWERKRFSFENGDSTGSYKIMSSGLGNCYEHANHRFQETHSDKSCSDFKLEP